MNDLPRAAAPLLLVLYLGVAFIWRSYAVWRQTGLNPCVLSRRGDAKGVIARGFRGLMGLLVAVVSLCAVSPRGYPLVAPVEWLEHPRLQVVGLTLLIVSLAWTAAAQAYMGRVLEDRHRRGHANRACRARPLRSLPKPNFSWHAR